MIIESIKEDLCLPLTVGTNAIVSLGLLQDMCKNLQDRPLSVT